MSEKEIVERIHELVTRYHDLEKEHHGVGLSPEQRQQLADLQVEVDHQWEDLRRARAAKRVDEMASLSGLVRPAVSGPGPVRSAPGGKT